ncbi:MAG: manganese catalase family protein [Oscillospiraceae bacterium]|jgi:bacterioferritin|nr:manganese catalase family protein [Oscillospiraceae bacterium]
MEYCANLPYPPIAVECKNPQYAACMLSNIGGRVSEMSAVAAYYYNNLQAQSCSKEIADAFYKINIVEMHHLQMFGELACLLGADPRLWERQNKNMVYWTPAYIAYPRDLKGLLTAAIDGEEETIRKYTKQAQSICDPYIVAVLERIILDEEMHVDILNYFLSQCGNNTKNNPSKK